MKTLKFSTLIIIVFSCMALQSCKRDKDEDLDIETQTSNDNYQIEGNINDALKEVDAASVSANLGKTGPTIIIDSTSSPKRMTIDYGTSTLCADGKLRSGKLIVTWTGRYRETGTVITITPESFSQNGNKLEGVKTIKNEGRNGAGNLYYTITVSNAKLTTAAGNVSTWNATRNREWISGESTAAWNDDVYLITGSASGVASNQISYTTTIKTAIRVDLSCQYRLTAGELEVRPSGKLTRTVNYGTGSCDNTFTVQIGNKTYTIN